MAEENTKYYIAPNSEIRVLKHIPLDNTYEHTIAWDEQTDARGRQEAYFKSHTKYVFPKQYYTRSSRGWVRVGQPSNVNPGNEAEKKKFLCADDFYDCNYMMFQNTSFGNKWFYAFITKVNYINDNTTELEYEIDVMQTWLRGVHYDYDPDPCFIERCHTASDYLYENLVPENIGVSEEYVTNEQSFYNLRNNEIVLICSSSPKIIQDLGGGTVTAQGKIINHVFGGASLFHFKNDEQGISRVNKLIKDYTEAGVPDEILAIYMCPREFFENAEFVLENPAAMVSTSMPNTYIKDIYPSATKPPKIGDALGYDDNKIVPKNNKLYSFPFVRLKVSNRIGSEREYKYELFNKNTKGKFIIVGKIAWIPGASVMPMSYAGFGTEGITIDYEHSVSFEAFPICIWASDSFRAWWAQNASSIGLQAGTSFVNMAAGAGSQIFGINAYLSGSNQIGRAMLGNGIMRASSGITSLGKILASISDATHLPDKSHGNLDSISIPATTEDSGFLFMKQTLRPDILKLYDDYFTKFGYAIKDIRKPPDPFKTRRYWTYVKTIGFNMTGKLNNEDSAKIAEIYDNGITFWTDPSVIGNYGYDNSPIV